MKSLQIKKRPQKPRLLSAQAPPKCHRTIDKIAKSSADHHPREKKFGRVSQLGACPTRNGPSVTLLDSYITITIQIKASHSLNLVENVGLPPLRGG